MLITRSNPLSVQQLYSFTWPNARNIGIGGWLSMAVDSNVERSGGD
jgi:hypothetical protein